MPRVCTVCRHPERSSIDRLLVTDEMPLRGIAGQTGLSDSALSRHKFACLPASLTKAQEAAEVAQADTLLGRVKELQARTLAILDAAEEAGELRTALMAIREARGNEELLGKLLGELQQEGAVNIPILVLRGVSFDDL